MDAGLPEDPPPVLSDEGSSLSDIWRPEERTAERDPGHRVERHTSEDIWGPRRGMGEALRLGDIERTLRSLGRFALPETWRASSRKRRRRERLIAVGFALLIALALAGTWLLLRGS